MLHKRGKLFANYIYSFLSTRSTGGVCSGRLKKEGYQERAQPEKGVLGIDKTKKGGGS